MVDKDMAERTTLSGQAYSQYFVTSSDGRYTQIYGGKASILTCAILV